MQSSIIPVNNNVSLVSVPVLSNANISTFPAQGIRNGSVQNILRNYNNARD